MEVEVDEDERLFENGWIWQRLVEVFIGQDSSIGQAVEQWTVQLLRVDIDIFIEI